MTSKHETGFSDRNLGVCVCEHVFDGSRPILVVLHYSDGDWGFFCGDIDHSDDYKWIAIGHLLDRDDTIHILSDLPKRTVAERDGIGFSWNSKTNQSI